ncbi:MAG: prephenate dehydrogenase [Acutalibacteraceae bacterium]|jgi:prephenate dehydrogenase
MEQKTIAVVGLGLIGGSMALALRRRTDHRVLGLARNPAVCDAALRQDAIHEAVEPADLARADVVLLALPPEATVDYLRQNGRCLRPGAVVSDVCGVKQAIVAACEPLCAGYGARFVGAHPMAGKEHSGFGNADADLFVGASYILTPTAQTDPDALETMRALARQMGAARLTETDPATHDRIIAFTSQLPHVLAGAYVTSPTCPQYRGFSAGSYRDVSRVATVDEHLWSRLFLLNADPLCAELDGLIARLQDYRDAIVAGDQSRLEAILTAGRLRKEENP